MSGIWTAQTCLRFKSSVVSPHSKSGLEDSQYFLRKRVKMVSIVVLEKSAKSCAGGCFWGIAGCVESLYAVSSSQKDLL
jgi:hypothetical protein